MTELSHRTVDLLILGAGWTSTFLIPLLNASTLSWSATSTTGHDSTLTFKFDPSLSDSDLAASFRILPRARFILITFPLKGSAQTEQLIKAYSASHEMEPKYIQLGSTGIWQGPSDGSKEVWIDRHSDYERNERAQAEDALLSHGGCVLNLSGLWGGSREPKNWIERVGSSKEKVADKTSLHMIHGVDVARAILAVVRRWKDHNVEARAGIDNPCQGQRWMLTDGLVYDWWALFLGWAEFGTRPEQDHGQQEPSLQAQWVYELMNETKTRALPRSMETLGRCYDSREFWTTFGLVPLKSRL